MPQNCLAEILTLPADADLAPVEVNWRGVDIPVMDPGADSGTPWRESGNSSGLVAVILGVRGNGPDYWGVALRGTGLSVRNIDAADCVDLPAVEEYYLAAFEVGGQVCQVPDLPALQGLFSQPDTSARVAT
ncbi:hypothetical protein DWB85_01135 [Seongchinamella sediminis]|uniref:CheW-like domain-containing protein n=1 Tax=Seongchinamella sediminis TaxID=2283635 RepID=A0A3L7E2K8_9GAMM|nr:hypothetical protein DWB85_01135 [Seongchinamella sediminis]